MQEPDETPPARRQTYAVQFRAGPAEEITLYVREFHGVQTSDEREAPYIRGKYKVAAVSATRFDSHWFSTAEQAEHYAQGIRWQYPSAKVVSITHPDEEPTP